MSGVQIFGAVALGCFLIAAIWDVAECIWVNRRADRRDERNRDQYVTERRARVQAIQGNERRIG